MIIESLWFCYPPPLSAGSIFTASHDLLQIGNVGNKQVYLGRIETSQILDQ